MNFWLIPKDNLVSFTKLLDRKSLLKHSMFSYIKESITPKHHIARESMLLHQIHAKRRFHLR